MLLELGIAVGSLELGSLESWVRLGILLRSHALVGLLLSTQLVHALGVVALLVVAFVVHRLEGVAHVVVEQVICALPQPLVLSHLLLSIIIILF